ncbi:MAG: hypothetical protein WCW78_03865 [Candidatus Paceibacterota bacterium]|jgi:hypothetical protein
MAGKGIVAFAFGTPENISSNQYIARIAAFKAMGFKAPVYTQSDIRLPSDIPVTYTEEISGEPPSTLRIARGAVQWAKELGFYELWTVAAKPHLRRCIRDMKRAIRESGASIQVQACEEISIRYSYDAWFCKNSTQARTRTKTAWLKREYILRMMPFFIYKHVAK